MKDRAAIYARFSSHNQRSESIEIQVEKSREYCEKEGLLVVREYCDFAQTGRNTDREQFQKMMADAKLGLFDYVVIYKVTRIMRNRDEMALARIMLRKAGVEILYAGEDISEGSSGVLQLGMLELLAEYESALDSERIRDGIQKNAQRCMPNGRTLYGWNISEDGKEYIVNERECSVLTRMKNMLLSGSTVAEIVRAVEHERSRNGKHFNQDTVTKLLKRVQNGGVYNYAGVTVEDGMPALWPREEQDLIISILNKRSKPHRRVDSAVEFPLSGKLYCMECGKAMTGMSGTSCTGRTYSYYKCKKCGRTFRRDLIEDCVADMTRSVLSRQETKDRIARGMHIYNEEYRVNEEPQSIQIQKELTRIENAYARIWQAIEEGIAPPGGRERVNELKARQAELESALRIAKQDEEDEPTVEELLEWLDDLADDLTDAELISQFVRAAQLDGDVLKLHFPFCHYGNDWDPSKKDELPPEDDSSSNSPMVEPKRKKSNYKRIDIDGVKIDIGHGFFILISKI